MPPSVAESKLSVYTVNYPLKYFAERIAREHADVVFPLPTGVDPAFWIPDTATIGQYQRADLIILNGANYAKWINTVTLPQLKFVNTSASFRDEYIKVDDVVTHRHGPGGEHAHTGIAFTTWLDFSNAAVQAKAIMTALSRERPEHQAAFERSFAILEKELLSLDDEIKAIVANQPNRPLLASRPVYHYFARRYGLNLKSVMWEAEEAPSDAQWAELLRVTKEYPAKWMIWEGKPNPVSVMRLQEMGVAGLVFDPCANTPQRGDFMSVMRGNVERLKETFKR